jgi:hypothetical protein
MVERGCLISLYTWPSTNLTAGSIPGTPISWCCPSPTVIQFESSQHPQTFITLTRLSSLGTEWCQKRIQRKDLPTMAWSCRFLNTETQVFFPVVSQWTGHKFFSNLLYVEILVKICRPKMLNTPLTLILLMWRIGWAPNNASKLQMGFNSPLKG